jgi:hypothetical protein
MRTHLFYLGLFLLTIGTAQAAPVIELEIATERGLQITAPQEWLQLLTRIGIDNVRLRSAVSSDTPAVTNRGTAERPRYHVVGILSSREELLLPGGSFGRGDLMKLKDYFDRLSADGGDRLTAAKGPFGLTEKELSAVFADLSQPVNFPTTGLTPQTVVERLQAKAKHAIVFDPAVERPFREAKPVSNELSGVSVGTALAIMLRSYGLVLRPEKPRGEPLVYRIAPAEVQTASVRRQGGITATKVSPLATKSRPGKLSNFDDADWPIGWETEKSPGEIAPSLFEKLNAEIDGYTLDETLAAIGPRLKVPYFIDQAVLTASHINPTTVKIKVDRSQMSYKRLLDRVLAQAQLGCDLRADEAGTVFLWIGK